MFCLYRLDPNCKIEYIAGIIKDGYSTTNLKSQKFLFESEQEIVEVREKFPELKKFSMIHC